METEFAYPALIAISASPVALIVLIPVTLILLLAVIFLIPDSAITSMLKVN